MNVICWEIWNAGENPVRVKEYISMQFRKMAYIRVHQVRE